MVCPGGGRMSAREKLLLGKTSLDCKATRQHTTNDTWDINVRIWLAKRSENDIWIYVAPICPLGPTSFSKHHTSQSFGFYGSISFYDTSCVMIATVIYMAISEGSMIPIDQQTKPFLRSDKSSQQNNALPWVTWIYLTASKMNTGSFHQKANLDLNTCIYIDNYTTLCKYIIVILYLLFIYIVIELHIHYFTMLEKMRTPLQNVEWIHPCHPVTICSNVHPARLMTCPQVIELWMGDQILSLPKMSL